jgi:hypothetical protein
MQIIHIPPLNPFVTLLFKVESTIRIEDKIFVFYSIWVFSETFIILQKKTGLHVLRIFALKENQQFANFVIFLYDTKHIVSFISIFLLFARVEKCSI